MKDLDPYRIQQIIKDTLIEITTQITGIKNMITESILDNYSLYYTYLQLKDHPNKSILLSILKKSSNKKDFLQVVESLIEYLESNENFEIEN